MLIRDHFYSIQIYTTFRMVLNRVVEKGFQPSLICDKVFLFYKKQTNTFV